MAEQGQKKGLLSKVFNAETLLKVGLFAATTAFSFAVMGGLDFVFFHEMSEGQAFAAAIVEPVTEFFRSGFFGGYSIADGFNYMTAQVHTMYPPVLTGADLSGAAAAVTGTGAAMTAPAVALPPSTPGVLPGAPPAGGGVSFY